METSDRNRKKWKEVLQLDNMSSEDTGEENELIVRPLPWLSDRVNKFKDYLDKEGEKSLNSQSKRQKKKKTIGISSSRQRPNATDSSSTWMYQN